MILPKLGVKFEQVCFLFTKMAFWISKVCVADRRDDDSMIGEMVLDLMMVMEEGNPVTIRTEENEANSEKHERTKTPLKT
ncbi:hypothetical protein MUG91_G36n36 [Manis pentadactyla]|nr:hypothetical protein MUG91_G36n36 [Manis pentadactyla]